MKRTLKFSIAALGLAILFGTSCKKYEEGPFVSFTSKEDRLVNTWKIEREVESDGSEEVPSQAEQDKYSIEFKDDGTYVVTQVLLGIPTSYNGTWEFSEDKEKITRTIDFGLGSVTSEYTIVKLKNKELALKDEDGDKIYYIEK